MGMQEILRPTSLNLLGCHVFIHMFSPKLLIGICVATSSLNVLPVFLWPPALLLVTQQVYSTCVVLWAEICKWSGDAGARAYLCTPFPIRFWARQLFEQAWCLNRVSDGVCLISLPALDGLIPYILPTPHFSFTDRMGLKYASLVMGGHHLGIVSCVGHNLENVLTSL